MLKNLRGLFDIGSCSLFSYLLGICLFLMSLNVLCFPVIALPFTDCMFVGMKTNRDTLRKMFAEDVVDAKTWRNFIDNLNSAQTRPDELVSLMSTPGSGWKVEDHLPEALSRIQKIEVIVIELLREGRLTSFINELKYPKVIESYAPIEAKIELLRARAIAAFPQPKYEDLLKQIPSLNYVYPIATTKGLQNMLARIGIDPETVYSPIDTRKALTWKTLQEVYSHGLEDAFFAQLLIAGGAPGQIEKLRTEIEAIRLELPQKTKSLDKKIVDRLEFEQRLQNRLMTYDIDGLHREIKSHDVASLPIKANSSGNARDSEFGDFNYGKQKYIYKDLSPEEKGQSISDPVFYGRPFASLEQATRTIEMLFQYGRNSRGSVHRDVKLHVKSTQNEASGFFSCSATPDVALKFAGMYMDNPKAKVLIMVDSRGAEVLDLNAFYKNNGIDGAHENEREIAFSTTISPKRIMAAFIFDAFGRLQAVAKNPNYEPRP